MGIKARVGVVVGTLVVMVGFLAVPAMAASNHAAFNAIPSVMPGNVSSVGFEATGASEFGQLVGLLPHHGHGGTTLSQVRVVMSSWGCKSGSWFNDTCSTPKNATFPVAMTLHIYAVDNSGPLPEPGALLKTMTKTFNIRYRPSVDNIDCPSGQWYDVSDSTCYNGFAQTITFPVKNGPKLPGQIIWTVQYNTSHYGPNPIGESPACYTSSGGCGYDSLNVGAETLESPSVGTDPDPDGLFWNTLYGSNYCDGGTGGTGTLRDDTAPGCWTGYQPLAEILVK